jgi:hypothetical protein
MDTSMFKRTKKVLVDWSFLVNKKVGRPGRKRAVLAVLSFMEGNGDETLVVEPDALKLRGFVDFGSGRADEFTITSSINTIIRSDNRASFLLITKNGSEYRVDRKAMSTAMRFLMECYLGDETYSIPAAIAACCPFYY